MTVLDEPNSMTAGRYTSEMQAEMDRLTRLLEGMRVVDFDQPLTDEDRKADQKVHALWDIGDMPQMAECRRFRIPGDESLGSPGCEAAMFRPNNAGEGLIFYIHGGGWCLCNITTHERAMRTLAQESGRTVVGVQYRLAPENPFPAGLMDVVSAYRKILSSREEFGLPAGPVLVSGDSAGANLALAVMLHEIREGRELPRGALLFYGVYGIDFETPSYEVYAEGHLLTRHIMRRLWEWYLPDDNAAKNPTAVPLAASNEELQALPPLFLVAAEMDPLTSDTLMLRDRLSALGRSDKLHIEPGIVHGFVQMTTVLEAAARVMCQAGQTASEMMDQAL